MTLNLPVWSNTERGMHAKDQNRIYFANYKTCEKQKDKRKTQEEARLRQHQNAIASHGS